MFYYDHSQFEAQSTEKYVKLSYSLFYSGLTLHEIDSFIVILKILECYLDLKVQEVSTSLNLEQGSLIRSDLISDLTQFCYFDSFHVFPTV